VLPGRVLHVSHQAEYTPHYALTERERVHLVFETRIAIEGAPAWLRPGLPAQVWLPIANIQPRLPSRSASLVSGEDEP